MVERSKSRIAPLVESLGNMVRRRVTRDDSLKSSVSQYLSDRIYSTPNVEVLTRTEVTALDRAQCLEKITLVNPETGQERRAKTHRLLICIGGEPQTNRAAEVGLMRDQSGYILLYGGERPANLQLDREPYYLETNIPGLFAAVDVRHGSVKRVASAVGEGAMSVIFVHRFLTDG